MILIADSGSTKTSWALLGNNDRYIADTAGFNPYYMGAKEIDRILSDELDKKITGAGVKEIYYYGSGCSTQKNCTIVGQALSKYFPDAQIEVDHDLLAAARALLGRSEGIACILGTGANSCAYNGEEITHNVPSLGYMFGDEGSGAYIGKVFLENYLKGKLAKEINDAFIEEYNYSLADILGRVYGADSPSAFMASFTLFLAKHEHHDDIREILYQAFKDFFMESVSKYQRYKMLPVSFVGSVAYHFRHILNEAAWDMGISIGLIEQAPMDGLIRFHSKKSS
jgi:N-acetylglucosamine kinase-like BadF-type ATPase